MAYLSPDYLHDVFVSYAWADVDQDGASPLQEWSLYFAEELRKELRTDFPSAEVYVDVSKRPGQSTNVTLPLTAELTSAVEGSAVLTVLVSEAYLNSKNCRLERESWITKHGATHASGAGRLLVVRALPTSDSAWPDELKDTNAKTEIGFWFYDRRQTTDAPRPYGWRRTQNAAMFTQRLVEVVGLTGAKLREMRLKIDTRLKEEAARQRLAKDGGQALYLHARKSNEGNWEQARDALQAREYAVFPDAPEVDSPEPASLPALDRKRAKLLAVCDALLLVAGQDETEVDHDLVAVGRNTRNEARSLVAETRRFPCAVVNPIGESLKRETRMKNARNLGIRWIDAKPPELPDQVTKWLRTEGDAT